MKRLHEEKEYILTEGGLAGGSKKSAESIVLQETTCEKGRI